MSVLEVKNITVSYKKTVGIKMPHSKRVAVRLSVLSGLMEPEKAH